MVFLRFKVMLRRIIEIGKGIINYMYGIMILFYRKKEEDKF